MMKVIAILMSHAQKKGHEFFGLMMGRWYLPETPAGVTENQKEEFMQNEMNCESKASDEARERVEEELSDLCEKMSKLTVFLYGEGRVKANLSDNMINLMARQLGIMKDYATTLQTRLSIWGKSNKELESLYKGDDNTQKWFG